MTVDPKLTALLMLALLVMAAPVAAHHKEGHTQGNTGEKAQQGPDAQDEGLDRSQDQDRGPPDHPQGDRPAQTPLPGGETDTEKEDERDETAGATDDSSGTEAEQASEDGSTIDSTTEDPGDDTSIEGTVDDPTTQTNGDEDGEQTEDPSAPDEGPTQTTGTQDVEQEHDQGAFEPTPEPAPAPDPASEVEAPTETATPEPATIVNESQSGSQGAFAGRLAPTTGQPLAANALDRDTASQDQGSGAQAAVSQAPGWDLAPLILIGLAALTGGGMATLRRPESSPDQAPEASPRASETTETSKPGPGTSLPPGAPALLELAQAAVRREDHEEAIGWFETAIALQPDLSVAHLCLGVCLARLDRDEEALESLGHAAQLAPGDPVPVYHQARILARTGRSQEALDRLARVVPVLPGEMVEAMAEDEAFSSLGDHPRFLALTGRL